MASGIRDKVAASRKRGLWMGGPVPLGYRVESRKLLVDEAAGRADGIDEGDAARGAHALYTDVWTSMGQEAEREKRVREFASFQVNAALLAILYAAQTSQRYGQDCCGQSQPNLQRCWQMGSFSNR